ncbi:hypothetical protein LCGC14_0588050 [marine sediment metagenome]|uniref:Uncharacterized protein n=1 Tax=marine sediment metagenome TaxID=412755 RepID=A0A0F9RYB8_9ZZZZ
MWDADRGKWVPTERLKNTQLTNAQVLALRATPITLVAAPGANLTALVHRVYIVSDDTAGAWTETDDNLLVEYADATAITPAIDATNLVGGGVQIRDIRISTGDLPPDVNAVVRIKNTGGGEWGGGNAANTMSVRVWYSIVPAVAFS